eukprot:TRINITY_DN13168_c0_g1_i2.p1 TRINITY_DN13168_c0_g1~~TRINITY_DN13168_c0_g1_i2.p1  ORF type:complete len:323 (+),score=59.76 TRINITY_DN13168_c0_g1_i2:48-971(+)
MAPVPPGQVTTSFRDGCAEADRQGVSSFNHGGQAWTDDASGRALFLSQMSCQHSVMPTLSMAHSEDYCSPPTTVSNVSDSSDSPPVSWRDLSPMKVQLPSPLAPCMLEATAAFMPQSFKAPPGLPAPPMPIGAFPWAFGLFTDQTAGIGANAPESRDVPFKLPCNQSTPHLLGRQQLGKMRNFPEPEKPTKQQLCQSDAQQRSFGHMASSRKHFAETNFTCKYVFTGYDVDRFADFELMPRLIGRGGSNMRPIAQSCGGQLRIRGRGSGHQEFKKNGMRDEPNDTTLEIVFSCSDCQRKRHTKPSKS